MDLCWLTIEDGERDTVLSADIQDGPDVPVAHELMNCLVSKCSGEVWVALARSITQDLVRGKL